ncbi:hypothetical protein NL676_029676 [Syzygium grande]|nr:hypothetical protein NL676_029676 [Syzygium grande]
MAGLGRTRISLPSQFFASFSFDRKFTICLSSSSSSSGVAFFGSVSYMMLPGIDVSKSLIYTPLTINPATGGTKISIVNPYTMMQTSIYGAVVRAFMKELSQVLRVTLVKPFGACFDLNSFTSTRVGPGVPQIDLVLQSSNVIWTMFRANSIVQAKESVLCLGFVDGGLSPRTSIVIGGHQL